MSRNISDIDKEIKSACIGVVEAKDETTRSEAIGRVRQLSEERRLALEEELLGPTRRLFKAAGLEF